MPFAIMHRMHRMHITAKTLMVPRLVLATTCWSLTISFSVNPT